MGCNESREKERPPINPTPIVATPLPLHIYNEFKYAFSMPPPLDTSSPTSLSPTSLSPTSPTTKIIPSPKASSTIRVSPLAKDFIEKGMSNIHYNKLKAIAYYKFPIFKDFSQKVQEQILLHIDKELKSMK